MKSKSLNFVLLKRFGLLVFFFTWTKIPMIAMMSAKMHSPIDCRSSRRGFSSIRRTKRNSIETFKRSRGPRGKAWGKMTAIVNYDNIFKSCMLLFKRYFIFGFEESRCKKNEKGQTILTVVGKIKDVNNLLLNNMTTAFIQHSTQTDFKRKKKRKQTF